MAAITVPKKNRIVLVISVNYDTKTQYNFVPIRVGRGPSGPSIEGPFCGAVHLCCALAERKIEKKKEKKKGKIEKRRERNEKKKKNTEILFIFSALLSF